MSVDNPYSGGNRFTGSGASELLAEAARGGRYSLGSPIGGGLAGAYTAEQILQLLAEQLATAPPDSAMLTASHGLFRINWFDGRFLTAQAFRQQDSYWDTRLRLLAQIFPPGISWGLGLGGVEATLRPYPPRGKHSMVDINTASVDDLQRLDGVGPARADRIVACQPFQSKQALESQLFDRNYQ